MIKIRRETRSFQTKKADKLQHINLEKNNRKNDRRKRIRRLKRQKDM